MNTEVISPMQLKIKNLSILICLYQNFWRSYVDVPCLDHPWDSRWGCPDDGQTKEKIPEVYYMTSSGSLMTGIPCLEHP